MLLKNSKVISILIITALTFQIFSVIHVGATTYSHPGGMLTQAQIDTIKSKVASNIQPWKNGYDQMISRANEYKTRTSHAMPYLSVPAYYVDPDGHIAASADLNGDAYAAYSCAMAYKFSGDTSYANAAVVILNSWKNTNIGFGTGPDSKLTMTTAGAGLIFAAELLYYYNGWNVSDFTGFKTWVANVYQVACNDMYSHTNNWKDWGIMGSLASYYLLDDAINFNSKVLVLKDQIDYAIASDGSMPEEVSRGTNGIWYTYFALAPLTAACNIVKNTTGENLFTWTSPNGKKIQTALDFLLFYAQNPGAWPYAPNPAIDPPNYNKWPVNLFEAMSGIYSNRTYANYVAPFRPSIDQGPHHFAWCFPTLTLQGNYSTTLFSDNFESGIANNWTTSAGNWSVYQIGNKVYNQTNYVAAGAKAYVGDSNWANYVMTSMVKLYTFPTGTAGTIGIYARYINANNYYRFVYCTVANTLQIQKCINGNLTTLATMPYNLTLQKWYTFKAEVFGSTLRFYLNGTKQLECTDTSISAGKIGLDANNTYAIFDDPQVTKLDNPKILVAQTTFSENFDKYTLTPSTPASFDACILNSGTISPESGRVKLECSLTTANPILGKNLSPTLSGNIGFESDVRVINLTHNSDLFLMRHQPGSTPYFVTPLKISNGKLLLNDNPSDALKTVIQTISQDVIYNIRITFNTTTHLTDVYVNGIKKVSQIVVESASLLSAVPLVRMGHSNYSGAVSTGSISIDNFKIYKFITIPDDYIYVTGTAFIYHVLN